MVALAPSGDPLAIKLSSVLAMVGYQIQQFNNDDEIDATVRSVGYGTDTPYICFGITFENVANKYVYNLRFNSSNNELPSPEEKMTLDRKIDMSYYFQSFSSGAIGITTLVNNLILQAETGSNTTMLKNKVGVIYQEPYVFDSLFLYLGNSFEFINLLPLLILFLRQTSFMLEEKEKKIRESMLITGMSLWRYYATWFIRYFVIYLIVHSANAGVIAYCLPRVQFYVPFVLYVLFDTVLIIQSFFIQIFVSRAKIGIVFALVFFILQYAVNYAIANNAKITA